jgi:hypothetical protein
MRTASRHGQPKRHAKPGKRRVPVLAAATLACLAVAFICLHGGSAAPASVRDASHVASGIPTVTSDQVSLDAHQVEYHVQIQHRMAAQRKHLAAVVAARLARQRAASDAPSPTPSASVTAIPAGGADPAESALGTCVRDTEEGGSYAWGRGNGGGAYQFLLGTWEKYGGAASEYGVAGAAYQNQIFNNAVKAGGASNWTDYDGC